MTRDEEARRERMRRTYEDCALTALSLIPQCPRCHHFMSDETPGAICDACAAKEAATDPTG